MSKKNNAQISPLVYSTDPNFKVPTIEATTETVAPPLQPLRVILETKHRAGKTVTIVSGFEGTEEDRNALGKSLKNHCGTGGAVKEGEIIIQGDHRQKVFQFLKSKGYSKTKL
jgi:translation initiation factor 1